METRHKVGWCGEYGGGYSLQGKCERLPDEEQVSIGAAVRTALRFDNITTHMKEGLLSYHEFGYNLSAVSIIHKQHIIMETLMKNNAADGVLMILKLM